MQRPGFIIAGTHSGCGKSTVATGLMRAFSQAGYCVQGFKCGPDYIDPGFHTLATGRAGRNLDTRMMGEEAVCQSYEEWGQKVHLSIVEGVMGLFDGAGIRDERGSAAHLAKVLGLPVILVLDVRAMARSAGALAQGFSQFDEDVNVAGFILNRVGSDRHGRMVQEAVEESTGRPVLGWLKKGAIPSLPERHLGLIPAWENPETQNCVQVLGDVVAQAVDLEALKRQVDQAFSQPTNATSFSPGRFSSSLSPFPLENAHTTSQKAVVAVARDAAFCFYYQDNLEMLEHAGAQVVFFSPLEDECVPEQADALYFGGGYPELHGLALAKNLSMRRSIREVGEQGMPILGECGGYMYLARSLVDGQGEAHEMVGLLSGEAIMGKRLKALGYCDARMINDGVLGKKGSTLSGHVFHWATMKGLNTESPAFITHSPRETQEQAVGESRHQVLASWVHFHFASHPQAAEHFVQAAHHWRESNRLTHL